MGGREEATVIGFGDRIPAVNATLVNSLMFRALDYNDIYWKEDPSHPSDIIPAALAVGELMDASMEDVINKTARGNSSGPWPHSILRNPVWRSINGPAPISPPLPLLPGFSAPFLRRERP